MGVSLYHGMQKESTRRQQFDKVVELPKANMKKRARSATRQSSVESQIYPTVAKYAIHYIATSTDGQLPVARLRQYLRQNPQLSNLSIDDLLRILDTYNSIFELEDTDRGKSHINVLLAFEFQVCDQPKKCGGYPTCRDLHICKYFIQNKCRQAQSQKCPFGHDLHSEHNLRILQEKYMDRIDPQNLKEWIQKHHNRRSRTSRPPQICTFYNTAGGCSKNDTCSFLHLCSFFVSRSCKFGSKCTRSHALSSKQNKEILRGHGIDITENEDQILDILSKNRSQYARTDNDESQRSGNKTSVPYKKDVNEKTNNMTPGAPFLVSAKSDRITLQWKNIGGLTSDFEYQIQYKQVPDGRWITHESAMPHDLSRAVITGLKSRTAYCFKVRIINTREGKEYPFSLESKIFDTPESPGLQMRYKSTLVNLGNPEIYRLLAKEKIAARNETAKSKKLSLGSERWAINDKTIMLVGATGSGKSTLIDGFANYLFGVNWEDNFRFTLVDLEHEEERRLKDQAVSQTEWITCYSIYPDVATKLDYALHIVDTPGFGDTRGIQRDQKIIEQIQEMFMLPGDKGMACLDAVCFLVKAPDARLTPSQKYIMDAILSLFGRDMEDNICICITFAEAQEPPVLASLAKSRLPHKYYFKFNNSALFACNENKDDLASGFWKIGMESFDSFFERLDRMETKSLQMTKEVLKTRQDLENTAHNLQSFITAGIGKISALEEEMSIFMEYKKQIQENKDFVYEVTEQVQVKEDISGKGQHTTNCLTCNYTCHEKCRIPEDFQKSHCIAMDEHGNCKQCPGNCQWQLHHNTPYIIRWVSKRVRKMYSEKLKLYETAEEQLSSRTEVLQKMAESVKEIERVIAQLLDKVTECNNRLKEIALNENPMNTAEYIELMIESEKREQKSGYMLRIKVLEDCRRKAMIGNEASDFLYKARQTRRGATSRSVPTSGSLISSMRSLMRLK